MGSIISGTVVSNNNFKGEENGTIWLLCSRIIGDRLNPYFKRDITYYMMAPAKEQIRLIRKQKKKI